ncbi:MAG: hypothetical protein WCV73_04410 [Patescibacteria group bacterium]|jgi:hypothetical protein
MLSKLQLFFRHINQRYYFDYFAIFFVALTLFSWLQSSPTLPEPDSFYHAKMAVMFSEGKILHQFPWLQETGLKNVFVDHHFLYHLLLVPFVTLFNPLIGVKIATVLFASFLVLSIYWLFKKFQIKYPFLFVIGLLTVSPWLFRVSLVKAPALALIGLILAFYFIVHQKWLGLFLISFLSVWLYAGWPIILVLTFVYSAIFKVMEKWRKEESIWHKLRHLFNAINHRAPYLGLAYSILGVGAGIIVNPYFPANLKFYWQQIFEIAVVNYQKVIGVGGEWYPYGFLKLISDAPLACSLLLISLLLFALTLKKQSIYSVTWGVLAVSFLLLTLKSRRQVEFFVPITFIFASFCFNDYLKKFAKFRHEFFPSFGWRAFFAPAFVLLGLCFVIMAPGNLAKAKHDIARGWNLKHYQNSGEWLVKNTPEKSIIFNVDWDDFPALFYYNSHNYYLTGLDPTFMYQNNPARYWKYVNITLGLEPIKMAQQIKNDFQSAYVFLDLKHELLNKQLKFNSFFKKVYEDNEARIYQFNP